MTSRDKQVGIISRPELDTPMATCMKMGPANANEAAKHGMHTLNVESSFKQQGEIGIPARTSQHRHS